MRHIHTNSSPYIVNGSAMHTKLIYYVMRIMNGNLVLTIQSVMMKYIEFLTLIQLILDVCVCVFIKWEFSSTWSKFVDLDKQKFLQNF